MNDKKNKREYEVMLCTTSLPQHMIRHHGVDNMTEFLLHNLCQTGCFNFTKAAYFIDNTDFNHFKGIAGVARHELYKKDHWQNPEQFSDYMKQSNFNQKVRTIARESIGVKNKRPEKTVQEIAELLELKDPAYAMWQIKYDNAGLLIFEAEDPQERESFKDHLYNAVHLFGFCPIF